eukprot:3200047-Prymnesium_polylepis.1
MTCGEIWRTQDPCPACSLRLNACDGKADHACGSGQASGQRSIWDKTAAGRTGGKQQDRQLAVVAAGGRLH